MEPSYRVNAHRDQLSPGKDVFAVLLEAMVAKWQDDTLTHSELVAWIRSQPRHPDKGTPLLRPDRSPGEHAADLISFRFVVVAADG